MSGDIQQAYRGPTDKDAGPVRRGGPEKCAHPCIECDEGHHFADPMIDFAEDEPEHEAAKLGVEQWWQCKHCPAWREYTGDEDDEPDPADEIEAYEDDEEESA